LATGGNNRKGQISPRQLISGGKRDILRVVCHKATHAGGLGNNYRLVVKKLKKHGEGRVIERMTRS